MIEMLSQYLILVFSPCLTPPYWQPLSTACLHLQTILIARYTGIIDTPVWDDRSGLETRVAALQSWHRGGELYICTLWKIFNIKIRDKS